MQFQLNNNGDTYETLSKQLEDCQNAAKALREAVSSAFPHGRNYQTHGDQASSMRRADVNLFANMAGTVAHFEAEIEQARIQLLKQRG